MAFYEIADSSQEDSTDLPWLNEWLGTQTTEPTGNIYLPTSVKGTQKGFVLFSDNFICWVWRKSKPGIALTTGLVDGCQSESYPQLAVRINTKLKDKFTLGFMDDCMAVYHWEVETSSYLILPQKNLPLEYPPSDVVGSVGKPHSDAPQNARRRRQEASLPTSKVESSQ